MATGQFTKARVGRSFFRFWFPRVVLILGMLSGAFIWAMPFDGWERDQRVLATLLVVSIVLLLLAIWLLGFSGYVWKRRLGVFFATLLLVIGVGWACIREVRYTGDMVPIIRFRWDRNRDRMLEAHHQQHPGPAAPATIKLAAAQATDFPAYRGQRRDGVVHGPALARDWTAHPPRLLWRQPVGGGYAAFAVAGSVAVTIEQRRDSESVVCYDAATGEQYWVYSYPAHFSESLGGDGPRATPTIADGDVYSLGATGTLVCLELTSGRLKWKVNILEDDDNLPWGMSGSPLVYDQLVVVNPGTQRSTASGKAVVAFDRRTGRQVWSAGSTKAGYSSPMLATLAGRRQVILLDGESLAGYDAESGQDLWQFPWQTFQNINAAQPLVLTGDRIFISSGYDHGCAMLRIAKSAGTYTVEPLWQNKNMQCKFASPVSYQGFLYGLDEGILTCVDAETGQRKWKDGRYGHGQLLLVEDLLLILSETGRLVLVPATPDGRRELGNIRALEDKTWNNPALADGKAFLRNSEEMACYDLVAPSSNDPLLHQN
jgi:outer membrane protein assembly factor BamB